MRTLAIAACSTVVALANAGPSLEPLDLDRPGVMEGVERNDPQLHLKITGIRDLATRMPCFADEFKRTLTVKFEARDAGCGVLLMTSYPSKRRLLFTLGEVRYVGRVRQPLHAGEVAE
jgi:hypothetical protein